MSSSKPGRKRATSLFERSRQEANEEKDMSTSEVVRKAAPTGGAVRRISIDTMPDSAGLAPASEAIVQEDAMRERNAPRRASEASSRGSRSSVPPSNGLNAEPAAPVRPTGSLKLRDDNANTPLRPLNLTSTSTNSQEQPTKRASVEKLVSVDLDAEFRDGTPRGSLDSLMTQTEAEPSSRPQEPTQTFENVAGGFWKQKSNSLAGPRISEAADERVLERRSQSGLDLQRPEQARDLAKRRQTPHHSVQATITEQRRISTGSANIAAASDSEPIASVRPALGG